MWKCQILFILSLLKSIEGNIKKYRKLNSPYVSLNRFVFYMLWLLVVLFYLKLLFTIYKNAKKKSFELMLNILLYTLSKLHKPGGGQPLIWWQRCTLHSHLPVHLSPYCGYGQNRKQRCPWYPEGQSEVDASWKTKFLKCYQIHV